MYYILLMGSGFLLVLALGQLCVPRRTEANIVLCLLLLVCFAWVSHGIGFRLGLLEVYPHLNKLHVPFLALTGPLWYLYIRTLLTEDGLTRRDGHHLLPALASTLFLLPFLIQSESFKRAYVEIEISGFVSLSIYTSTRIAELATIAYLMMTIRELRFAQAHKRLKKQAQNHRIVFGLTIVAVIAAIARLFGSVTGNHTVSVFLPIVMILPAFVCFYCLSYRHPWLMTIGKQTPAIRLVNDRDKERLNFYRERMRAHGWHLDPDLKIQQLARRLGVPAHELSRLINQGSGGNFNHFVNALRIEHAKSLLLDETERTVLDVALASGFNSVSAFYAQFTRFESEPPASYRKRALESNLKPN